MAKFISICTMFKNEARYLKEWIEYHLLIGVEHFYLYDNRSTDNPLEILHPYIKRGLVTYSTYDVDIGKSTFPWSDPKYPNNDCTSRYHRYSKWIAYIDVDEFIYIVDGTPLDKFLAQYSDYDALAVHFTYFGSSNNYLIPSGLVIENYVLRPPTNFTLNKYVKTIAQPSRIHWWRDPHVPQVGGQIVRENKSPFISVLEDKYLAAKITIFHYSKRAKEDYIFGKMAKVLDLTPYRGPQAEVVATTSDFATTFYSRINLWEATNMLIGNSIEDMRLCKYAPQLRERLGMGPISVEDKLLDKSIVDWRSYLQVNPDARTYLQKNTHYFYNQYMSTLFHHWFLVKNRNPQVVKFIPIRTFLPQIKWGRYFTGAFEEYLNKYLTISSVSGVFSPNIAPPEHRAVRPTIIIKFYLDYEIWIPPEFEWTKYLKSISLDIPNEFFAIVHYVNSHVPQVSI